VKKLSDKATEKQVRIFGYANVPGRESRPVMTPRGKVVEIIEQRAFARALKKAKEIKLLVDHDRERAIATTADGSLKLEEDNVGLRAEASTSDPETVAAAEAGAVKGWSFDMTDVVDEIEQRADKLPLRRVKDFAMSEISLIVNAVPYYSSSSFETRAGVEGEVERRCETDVGIAVTETENATVDNSSYAERVKKLEKEKKS
jgi:HK97 family phage prohead protease